jgi:heme exporter protein A
MQHPDAPLVEARHLSKRLGERSVLRDLTFRLDAGEVLAVVGPNGAGKSTLLKLVAGIWAPSAGTLTRFGQPPREDPADARIGYLGHQSLLYRLLSGLENLVFYARLYGLSHPRERAEAALRRVGMHRFMHDPVRTYSRGMEQRVAIARAFLHEPQLLLLDEPYTGLDWEARSMLDKLVGETVAQGGGALLITHHLDEAERLATRVGILWQGRLGRFQRGGPEGIARLADDYAELFRAAGGRRGP